MSIYFYWKEYHDNNVTLNVKTSIVNLLRISKFQHKFPISRKDFYGLPYFFFMIKLDNI